MRPSALDLAARALALAILAGACGGTHSQVPAEGDAVVFQKVLDGVLAAQDGLSRIAQADGWPISTSKGYLFAIADGGQGPYKLVSPGAAFPDTALRSEAGVAWALVPIASPAGVSYRYLDRSGSVLSDGLARRFAYLNWDETSLVAASGPHFERWQGVGDAKISARTLRVWVPAQAPTRFLYAHDGQNLFSPRANYGGWSLQDAAGPATLVVGIDNSPARMDEYTHVQDLIDGAVTGGRGADYVDYVELTVRPLIETRYGKPSRSGVIGSSLGGLISYYQELRHPGSWDFVASLSGTMGWGSIGPSTHNPTMIELYRALGTCPAATFYLDAGGGPGSGCVDSDHDGVDDDTPDSADNYCENLQLLGVLRAIGCTPRLTWRWAQGAGHNEAAWAARAPAILALFETL